MTQEHNCHICGHKMERHGLYLDCGGDCMLCMAKFGDTECITGVLELAAKYHTQLGLVKENLFRGLSHGLQKLQARSIDEVLQEDAGTPPIL